MQPMIVTVGPLASAVANNICTSQTPTAALTLNGSLVTGGVAYLDTPRRILFTEINDRFPSHAKTIVRKGKRRNRWVWSAAGKKRRSCRSRRPTCKLCRHWPSASKTKAACRAARGRA